VHRLAVPILLVVLVAGCGGAGSDTTTLPAASPATPATTTKRHHRPRVPRCAPDAANCRSASGRVIALESVDPDGDGDLHLILASSASITLPGVTVLDVSRALRPRHDPRVGDWAAGAGPVYTGSHGQHQIQVERVVVDPAR
jgi:hypothetical protein